MAPFSAMSHPLLDVTRIDRRLVEYLASCWRRVHDDHGVRLAKTSYGV